MLTLPVPIKRNQPALMMKGELEDYSSEALHAHRCHQFLTIRNGVSILEDAACRQPLYGSMCAFLPAGLPHRSIVAGSSVTYQSIYIRPGAGVFPADGIVVFSLSRLAGALYDFLTEEPERDLRSGVENDSLRLFLRLAAEGVSAPSSGMKLPGPVTEECRKLVDYMERKYAQRLNAEDFCSVLPYSSRHIARLFCAEMKMTLFEYLRIYRIIQASIFLHDRNRQVLEISLSCGYDSLSSFYADFRRFFSVTPLEFRGRVSSL